MFESRLMFRGVVRLWTCLSCVLLSPLVAVAIGPAGTKGIDSRVISAASGNELAPAVAFGGEVALIAWEYAYSADDHDVWFAPVNAYGIPLGYSIYVATSTRWEGAPAVAYSGNSGNFLVVWEEVNPEGDWDVLGRLYESNGTAASDVLEIAVGTSGQRKPAVAWGDDTWLVVWEHLVTAEPLSNDLRARRLGDDGTVSRLELVIASGGADESAPAVAWGGSRFLVAWQEAAADEYDIAARTVASTGDLGSPATLANWEYDQIRPSLAYSPEDGSFLVVWEDHHWGWGEDWDIYARRVNAEGSVVGGLVGISWEGGGPRTAPAVAYDSGNAEYQVVWEYDAIGRNRDLYRRRVSPGGILLGAEVALAELTVEETSPAVAGDGRFGYLVAWEDLRNAAVSGRDLYAEFVEQFRLSGRVYAGTVGDTSLPLPGVTVRLHCSGNQGVLETLVDSTTTDPEGWWGLPVTAACDFHELWMVNPEYHLPDDATSVGGEVLSPTWIEYAVPLRGKILTGNRFFTVSQDPVPEPWANFSPSGWWTSSLVAPVTVQISDVGSGLDVSTAEHRVSRDGGTGWTAWSAASCSGSDGSNGPETVSADVTFEGDNGTDYLVQFAISDLAMQPSESPVYPVKVDTTPPVNPPSVESNLSTSTWYGDSDITLSWQPGTDATSGVAGYSFLWSTSASTFPDASVDDQDNHIEDTIPGDGQTWYFHLRTVDQAGNAAGDAIRTGPYWLDTARPTNPASITCSPLPGVWTASSTVSCSWDAGADGASGVGGYSYLWNTSPSTVPDVGIDTTQLSAGSPILASGLWYFHLRTVDAVGNPAATAVHRGPFKIDRDPPSSSVNPLAANQATTPFPVSWGGSDGAGSGITSYDIRIEDLTAGTTETHTRGSTSEYFTGERGHTYLFSSRARDLVGNLEAYPAAGGDALTTVGASIPIRVRNQSGSGVSGAKVYHNGSYVGVTDGSGLRYVPGGLVGDTVAAIHEVYEHPATKPHHGSYGSGNWAWRAYQTSWAFNTAGDPQLHSITGTSEQVLTVRADQPLIGIHHITAIEFDASVHFTNTENALPMAAAHLYDATDGQMIFEINEVFDNGVRWVGCDMQIHASNSGRANAHRAGMEGPSAQHINLNRANPALGWATTAGSQVIVHEWGHYGMGLYDEYLDRSGQEGTGAYCAKNRGTVAFASRSSIMDRDASEFCSRVDPNHEHMTNTQHDKETGGESTWESIKEEFTDSQNPPRWVLQTPDDRGAIMPGPTAIPVELVKVYGTDANTGACQPFQLTVSRSDGTAAKGATVNLITSLGMLPQGLVRQNGTMSVVGARIGDFALARVDDEIGFTELTFCAATSISLLAPSGPGVSLSIAAVDGDTLEIAIFGGELAIPPTAARLVQEGAEPVDLSPAWDAARSAWVATVDLNSALERTGHVDVRFEDGGAIVAADIETFTILPLSTSADNTRLMSDDGGLELVVPAASLDSEAWVTIHSTDMGASTQGDLRRVGRAYGVHVSSQQESFDPPAVVNLRWDAVASDGIDRRTIQLHRWNAVSQTWELVGGTANPEHDIVSVEVDQFSVFGALGKLSGIFEDGFESGDTTEWSSTVP